MTSIRHVLPAIAALALAITAGAASANSGDEFGREIIRGRQIAPVTLTIPAGVSATSVYLGSYIVNAVADCNGCHSNNEFAAGGNPFLGQPKQVNTACYLNGGQAFGPFISRNITPDGTGMPAGITYAAFKSAMQTGNDPMDPGTLLQVMPWTTFQNMTDLELKAIYDYLSSIPSLPDGGTGACVPPPPP